MHLLTINVFTEFLCGNIALNRTNIHHLTQGKQLHAQELSHTHHKQPKRSAENVKNKMDDWQRMRPLYFT